MHRKEQSNNKPISIGESYGRLIVIEGPVKWRVTGVHFICLCSCGKEKVIRARYLRLGLTKSCGCIRRERMRLIGKNPHAHSIYFTHGATRGGKFLSGYWTWFSMIRRCEDPKQRGFIHYGGRGITVCSEWRHDFRAFIDHIGPRPSLNHSIDRIDVNGNYEPGNVRWATSKEQAANKRRV